MLTLIIRELEIAEDKLEEAKTAFDYVANQYHILANLSFADRHEAVNWKDCIEQTCVETRKTFYEIWNE